MKNRIIISLLFLSMGIISVHAQDKKIEYKEKRQATHNEMKAYMEKEIKPLVAGQRDKLDTYLSKKEQREIETLRTEMKSLRAKSIAFRKELRSSYTGPNSLTESQKKQSVALKKEKRLLDTRAWEIADAHESEIAQLLSELEPNMETWSSEMRAIMQKNRPARTDQKEEWLKSSPSKGTAGKRGHMGKSHAFKGGRHGDFRPGGARGGMNMRSLKSPIGFLLWDAKGELPYENNAPQMSVFPNPSRNSNTLEFTLKEAGPVVVNLLNDRGILIKTLLDETKEAGTFTEKFDLTDLEKGLYIYQIKTADGITSKKLIIEK